MKKENQKKIISKKNYSIKNIKKATIPIKIRIKIYKKLNIMKKNIITNTLILLI
jgi:hypothetical protein